MLVVAYLLERSTRVFSGTREGFEDFRAKEYPAYLRMGIEYVVVRTYADGGKWSARRDDVKHYVMKNRRINEAARLGEESLSSI